MTSQRSETGRYRDWDAIIAQLRTRPGEWVVRLPNEPRRLVRTVRFKQAPELHLTDGVIEVDIVNEYTDDRGIRRGDVHLRFNPAVIPLEEGNHA